MSIELLYDAVMLCPQDSSFVLYKWIIKEEDCGEKTKLYELMDELFRSNQSKYTYLSENPKEKTTMQERLFHYISEKITMVTVCSHALEFLGLIDRTSFYWRGSIIYTCGCLWISLQSAHLFKHLFYRNCLSWRRLELNFLIWMGRAWFIIIQWSLSSCKYDWSTPKL